MRPLSSMSKRRICLGRRAQAVKRKKSVLNVLKFPFNSEMRLTEMVCSRSDDTGFDTNLSLYHGSATLKSLRRWIQQVAGKRALARPERHVGCRNCCCRSCDGCRVSWVGPRCRCGCGITGSKYRKRLLILTLLLFCNTVYSQLTK